ncbi:hypothetical protein BH18ACT7_BH18ACT7_10510 [soil metagenome]
MPALLDLPPVPARRVPTRDGGVLRVSLVVSPAAAPPGVGQAPTRDAGSVSTATGLLDVTAPRESTPSHRVGRVRPQVVYGGSCARALESSGAAGDGIGQHRTRPVRLTRRGRLAVTFMTLLATVILLAVAAAQSGSTGGGLADAPRSVVVEPGDTLWQIAREIAPADSPAVVVAALQEANGLDGGPLQPGQVLAVPAD